MLSWGFLLKAFLETKFPSGCMALPQVTVFASYFNWIIALMLWMHIRSTLPHRSFPWSLTSIFDKILRRILELFICSLGYFFSLSGLLWPQWLLAPPDLQPIAKSPQTPIWAYRFSFSRNWNSPPNSLMLVRDWTLRKSEPKYNIHSQLPAYPFNCILNFPVTPEYVICRDVEGIWYVQ